MLALDRKKILRELENIPSDKMPKIYKMIHLVSNEIVLKTKTKKKRGSLKGIWKGINIDESVFSEARESLFPYEYK